MSLVSIRSIFFRSRLLYLYYSTHERLYIHTIIYFQASTVQRFFSSTLLQFHACVIVHHIHLCSSSHTVPRFYSSTLLQFHDATIPHFFTTALIKLNSLSGPLFVKFTRLQLQTSSVQCICSCKFLQRLNIFNATLRHRHQFQICLSAKSSKRGCGILLH